jgi:hypothetical protein
MSMSEVDAPFDVGAYSPVGPVRCPRCKSAVADVPVGGRSCGVCGASESDGRAPDLRMLAGIESPQSPEELLAENLRLKAELAAARGVPESAT